MPTFHYLISKVREASQDEFSLILSTLDLNYLKKHGIHLEEKIGDDGILRYTTSASILKKVFCI